MDISFLQDSLTTIDILYPTPGVIMAIFIAIILLVASAFASGSEIAFFSLTPKDISQLSPESNIKDKMIIEMREDSERTLATILIANNLVNVTIIMLCNYIFASIVNFHDAYWLQFIITTILLTFLLLLFGEIIPKVYCRQSALSFCRRMTNPLRLLRWLFWPLECILLNTGLIAGKIVQKENHILSVDELEQALEMTDKADIRNEQKILQGIIRFGDETVREVMTNRQDLIDLEVHSTFGEVLKCIIDNNYSRIPIYQGNEDNIRGILYIKDLLPHLSKPETFHWQSLIRPPYFVPETKKIDDLLSDFKKNRIHIAIVVDEFGGTSGIVTMEDILEEIVGEINDEFDEEKHNYTKLNYNTYIFEGKTELDEVFSIIGQEKPENVEKMDDVDTLAGLILELKGDFPSLHERFDISNITFEIMAVEERRISRVKVIVHNMS